MRCRVSPNDFAELNAAYQRQAQFRDDERWRLRQRLRQRIAPVTSLNDFASGDR